MILVADIGGTKVDMALCDAEAPSLNIIDRQTFATSDHKSLGEVILAFLKRQEKKKPSFFALGVAGPVIDDEAQLTNLSWRISKPRLEKALLCPVEIVNDMVAHAYGALHCTTENLSCLQSGTKQTGNAAILAAGTGLGEAQMTWDGEKHLPFDCEGGHASFSPQNKLQMELLEYAFKTFKHVSAERLISGKLGMPILVSFFKNQGYLNSLSQAHQERLATEPAPGALVSQLARQGDPGCQEIIKTFIEMYACEAANLALKSNCRHGLFLSGGIAKKLQPEMEEYFIPSFLNKGRFKGYLQSVPVYLVQDECNAIHGLYQLARRQM